MKIKNLILCSVMGLVLTSCATKQSAISQLEDFSTELRDNSRYYGAEDWQKAGKKFVKIRKNVSKHEFDYTAEEKARIGRLEGECARYMAKGAKEGFFDKLRNQGYPRRHPGDVNQLLILKITINDEETNVCMQHDAAECVDSVGTVRQRH